MSPHGPNSPVCTWTAVQGLPAARGSHRVQGTTANASPPELYFPMFTAFDEVIISTVSAESTNDLNSCDGHSCPGLGSCKNCVLLSFCRGHFIHLDDTNLQTSTRTHQEASFPFSSSCLLRWSSSSLAR